MTSLTPSAFHPLHLNPLLASDDLEPVSRSALQLEGSGSDLTSRVHEEDHSEEDAQPTAFARDTEGESILQAMLLGLLGTPTPQVSREDDREDVVMTLSAEAEPEVLDFRLFSTRPVSAVRLVPLHIEHHVPNPNHTDLSKAARKALRIGAQAASITAETILAEAARPSSATSRRPRSPVHFQLDRSAAQTALGPGALPALLCTSRPSQTANSRMRAHGFPPPAPPERGPGGHLPCAQLPILPSTPASGEPPAIRSSKRKRPKKRHCSLPSAPPRQAATFYQPSPSLGGKALGYAYGYGLGRAEWVGTKEHEVPYLRDRMGKGWVNRRKGESWWGSRKDKGGPVAKETAKARRKALGSY